MADALGTTSACAENTNYGLPNARTRRNYLRVRGEYFRGAPGCSPAMELPPRARRILEKNRLVGDFPGTTSACAENTSPLKPLPRRPRNYLRVRGEYYKKATLLFI